MRDLTGIEVGGYRVTGPLARGGFAEAHLAEGPDGAAVLKVGRDRGGSADETAAYAMADATAVQGGETKSVDAVAVDAILRAEGDVLEAAAGAAGLPRLYATVEHSGRPALLMERVPGISLAAALRSRDPLPLDAVVVLARALADAIAAGSIPAHGDLKPANLLLEGGRLRPIDPGVLVDETIASTPAFNPLLQRSPDGDRVALAGMLYAYATGRAPFSSPAPPRACLGDQQSWRGFLAIQLAPLEPREGFPQALVDLIRNNLESALEPCGVEGLRRLADDLEQVVRSGCAALVPATVSPAAAPSPAGPSVAPAPAGPPPAV